MSISIEQRNDLITLLVGMFDAAPSAELLTGFTARLVAGTTLPQLANDLATTDEFASLYSASLSRGMFASNFVNNILDGNTNSATTQEAIDFVRSSLYAGASRGEAVNAAVSALMAIDVANTQWGAAVQGLMNKVDVANYFATTKVDAISEFASLRAIVAGVNADTNSVSKQKALIDAGVDSLHKFLTTGADFLEGGAGNDTFTAWIFNNQNTAQTDDQIDGRAGEDTLIAEIGDYQDSAITLKTHSVEVIRITTRPDDRDNIGSDSDSGDETVQLSAQEMSDAVEFWSADSRGSLSIEHIQTDSDKVTLGWKNSDAGDINYEVYFDNITAPARVSEMQLSIELLDFEGMRAEGNPLLNNPYYGLIFSLNGVYVVLEADAPAKSYLELVDDLNHSLAAQGLTSITASLGTDFTAINPDDSTAYTGTTVVLTNLGPELLGGASWMSNAYIEVNVHTAVTPITFEPPTPLTQTNVVFDYVGNGARSADFVAGDASAVGDAGIGQFNVSVDRDSWLHELRSTNNALQVVNVESIGAVGTLRIDELNDAQTFNATAMQNSVNLTAALSEEVIAKYGLHTAPNAIEFDYLTGGSADVIAMTLAQEVATSEHFKLMISTGYGDDDVTLLVDGDETPALGASQTALGNLVVTTGAGNDTVRTLGSGDVTINVGRGDDIIVLSSHGDSNNEIVFEGTRLGNVDILNFDDAGTSMDTLNFTHYLQTLESQFGNSDSRVNTTLGVDADTIANEVTVLTFTAGTGVDAAQTFAAMTSADLLAAINFSNLDSAADYGSIGENTLEAGPANMSFIREHVVLLENSANLGEYKAFALTSWRTATNLDFATAELIGTFDLGATAVFTVGNIV